MIDFLTLPSPCYILDEQSLLRNMAVIDKVRHATGAEIIVALKACAMWRIFPTLREHSDGATASSAAEARLVLEEYGCKTHTYAPVYTDADFPEILRCSDHITFNSLNQWQRFGARARAAGVSCGLRVNPLYSTVETDLYNPAAPDSRLGIHAEELPALPDGIEGIHFHTLCESRPDDLEATLTAFEQRFGHLLPQAKWVNMGGGHLMTAEDYDENRLIDILRGFRQRWPHLRVILEPGSAFTWRTGWLTSTIQDIVHNGGVHTAMLDVSFACHMPDTLEMPYKPAIIGAHDPREGETRWRMGGNCCLAGDYKGDWAFDREPQIGDRIVFEDMIHYTMVKTTMFNGVSHPSIAILHTDGRCEVVRRFGYEDFRNRMS
ncbi:MAG TPA: carboxynorspermidine decarboxylase [Candidatus Tidjanibacter faecipullorum]|uniref:Carboxynorspermidine/carboxyspermidine decarboxylase n=1 Tax=Candidatus Tidjanibacter faecipullorum TaxID=2838766 RepID=A0A9D2DEW3_9BACT|nr:carboxynorspermidine decarboxylase [Candidatus Tidjanibacter faecipullorum]